MKLDIKAIRWQARVATSGRGRLMTHPWLTVLERTEMTEAEVLSSTSQQKIELLRAARHVAPLCREIERLRKIGSKVP